MKVDIKNAPTAFRLVMDITLTSEKWQFALVCLGQILNISQLPRQHINYILPVLSLLKEAGVTLMLKKCAAFRKEVKYCEPVARRGRLKVANYTSDAISDLKMPTKLTKLSSFTISCSVLYRFVPNFACIASPLPARLHKTLTKGKWQLSYEKLKGLHLHSWN